IEFLEIETIAFVIQKLNVLLPVTVQDHVHVPGSREHFWIFDRHGVADVIGIDQRIAFYQVQSIAVKVAGSVKPGPVVQMGHVDDERVPFPASARIAKPPIDAARWMWSTGCENEANGMHVLVEERDFIRLL